jgi:DNA-binding response OmpR family regulator
LVQEIRRKRILFVDHEQTIRLSLPPILAKHGFEVTSVGTLFDALAKILGEQFDILLVDLSLPDVNGGFLVIEEMRRAHPGCINFILTGVAAEENFQRATSLQVAHIFIKPVEIHEMAAIMTQKLARHSPTRSGPNSNYPWQQAVRDAFMEGNPVRLPERINVAERAIAARLCDLAPANLDEQAALRAALRSLRLLFPGERKEETGEKPAKKKDIA